MTWHGGDRKARLPADWTQIRRRILTRDGHACRTCGAPANQVDHVTAGDDHRDVNLQALCQWHHTQKSSREGGTAAAGRRRAMGKRQPEPHPGLRH